MIGVDDRRCALVAVFVAVDVELGHDFLPGPPVARDSDFRRVAPPAYWIQAWRQAKGKSTDVRTSCRTILSGARRSLHAEALAQFPL